MGRSVIIVYFVLVLAGGFLLFRFSNNGNSSNTGHSEIQRIEVPPAVKNKVDKIFAQADWDYNTWMNIRRSSSRVLSQDLVDAHKKYSGLLKQLDQLGPVAYPAIIKYVSHQDKMYKSMAVEYIRGLNDKPVDALMFALGDEKLTSRERKEIERLLSNAVNRDYEPIAKFLFSDRASERLAASDIIAEPVKREIDREVRYSYYRYVDTPRRTYLLPLSYRARIVEAIENETDPEVKVNLVMILSGYGEANDDILEKIIALFKAEKDNSAKAALANCLGVLASNQTRAGAAKTLAPITEELSSTKSTELRHSLIRALKVACNKLDDQSVNALIKAKDDRIESIGLEALQVLTLAAKTRKDCAKYIEESFTKSDRKTINTALSMLPFVEKDNAVIRAKLLELVNSDRFGSGVVRAVGNMGKQNPGESVAILREVLKTNGRSVVTAISELNSLRPASKAATPELKAIVQNKSYGSREAARLLEKFERGM